MWTKCQPRPSRGKQAQGGPVGITLALGNALDEMIRDQTRDRHRHGPGVGCCKRQARMSFKPSDILKPVRGNLLLSDNRPMGSIE